MANEFIARKGLIARASSQITGSLDTTNFFRSVEQTWYSGTSPTSSLFVSGNLELNGGASSYTHTFPTASTTLVGTDVTQTLTNKQVSGSFSGSGANVYGVVSSSYALSASYADNGGSTGGGITWTAITSEQTASVDNGYLMNNASQLKLHLPATSAVGKVVRLAGLGVGGWIVGQGAGQRIHFGSVSSSLGTGGSIASTHFRDSVEMVCVVVDDEWQVISAVGSIEVT